mmetsp:Transcript_25383/g.71803  ORF Transcript_25383/g.71803 Transcript_25383/m.71803 type:complete len:222 (+) Transcript_25383:106-771(+)
MGTHLIHLEDVAALLLELLHLRSIHLATSGSLRVEGLRDGSRNSRNWPGGTAKVEEAVLLAEQVSEERLVLDDLVLDVDLLLLVAAKGETEPGDQTLGGVGVPLVAVEPLLVAVASTKVEDDRADFNAHFLLVLALLHKRAEGRHARAEAGHDDGLLGRRGKAQHGGLDIDGDVDVALAGVQAGEVASALAKLGAAERGLPVHGHHKQVNAAGVHLHGRGD